MALIEKNTSVIDERLYSEEFRKSLLTAPVIIQKQQEAKKLAKAIQKSGRK
jgi:hypothetical protein